MTHDANNEPHQPTPVPVGDGRHDIGDAARLAIYHRLMADWCRDPDLAPEKKHHLAMFAAASVRALLHETGVLRDMAAVPAPHREPETSKCESCDQPATRTTADDIEVCEACYRAIPVQQGPRPIRREPETPPQVETATRDSLRGVLWDRILEFSRVTFSSAAERQQINAAIDALLAPQRDPETPSTGWQPIETAPKDRSAVLGAGYDAIDGTPVLRLVRFGSECGWYCATTGRVIDAPTHWMPLPALPSAETREQGETVRQCEQTIAVAGERIRCVFDSGHSGGHASGTKVWSDLPSVETPETE